MSIFKEPIPEEPNLSQEQRIRRNYKIGYKRNPRVNWQYYTLVNADCDTLADEVAKQLLLGRIKLTVAITDNEE